MGRVLAKRFFGNTNPGGIPAGDVASVTVGGTNTGYAAIPVPTFAAPTLPGGVTAVAGTVTMNALTATLNAAGTGYHLGDVLTLAGGTGTAASVVVATLKAVAASVGLGGNGGAHPYVAGNTLTFSTGWSTPAVYTVATVDGSGLITAGSFTTAGVWATGTPPTNPVTPDSQTTIAGTGATINITYGVASVDTLLGGNYSALPAGARATTAAPTGGTGATVTLSNYAIRTVAVATPGSGYTTAPLVTVAGNASLTAVLGNAGVKAIVAHAYTGGSLKSADVVKQTGSHRYKVNTSDTLSSVPQVAYLKATAATAVGQMNIMAYDANGSSYYVTKLTRHHAVLTRGVMSGSFVWATGDSVNWWFNAADATHALIENA